MKLIDIFFRAILPTAGKYVVVSKGQGNGEVSQRVLTTPQAVIDFCEINQMNAKDCWFAPASYKQGWHMVACKPSPKYPTGEKPALRTQNNTYLAKALWLDIDVADDKPYKTRQEASEALATFIKEIGLPRPFVIGSGERGLHLYFAIDEEITRDEWQYLADRLKQACREYGIHQDPSRTADIASILRCPYTWNMKQVNDGSGNAHQVDILELGETMPHAEYRRVLDRFTPTTTRHSQAIKLTGLEKAPKLPFDVSEYVRKYFQPIKDDYPTRPAIEVLAGCEQMRLQKGATEPLWRGMLGTLRHCEHGRYVAHKVSAIDDRYDPTDTDNKLDQLEANDIAPFTCDYFRAERPEVCARCPFNGLIKSPISVPKVPRKKIDVVQVPSQEPAQEPAQEPTQTAQPVVHTTLALPTTPIIVPMFGNATPVANTQVIENTQNFTQTIEQQEQVTVQTTTKTIIDFDEIKTKDSLVNSAGCWARVKNSDGEWQWLNIYPYPVYPLQRVRGRTAKGETTISYIFRKHNFKGYDDIQIDGSSLMGQTLNATLGNYGFLLTDKERKLMASLLINILKETESTIGEVKTTDNLGWDDSHETFLLGNKLYKTDGKVFEVAVTGKAKIFSEQTTPRGSLDIWKRIADIYNRDGLEWGQAVVASAFASPLMPLGALEKSALLFVTGDKGIGKSTALKLALSVYGNPERMLINKDDTYLARLNKLGIMNSISACFDEMTDLSPKEASELAYQITQGRGKDRMSSGGEDMVLNTTYWSCLPVMSANDSIINALSQHGKDPTAQMSRVLEVQATNINDFLSADELDANERLLRQLPENFGTAGDMFMRYVTSHKTEVIEMIYQIEKRFKTYAKLNSNYRFWSYMCTRMIVGVMIANKLGLLNYNVAKLFAYLVKQVERSKKEIDGYQWSPENAVPNFLTHYLPNRIVVTHEKRPSTMPDNVAKGAVNDAQYVVQAPANGRELVMRVELDTGNCLISLNTIKEWCKKGGVAMTDFISLLGTQYDIISKRTRRDLGKQTVFRGVSNTECIVIRLPKEAMSDISAQNNEA